MIDDVAHAVDDLTEVVGRDVGRHTDRDTRRTIDEQVGNTGRQNDRLLALLVEVGHEVNGFLLDVGEHDVCDLCHTRLGVTVSRRGVAVDGTKVTVTIDKRITEGERLCHTYHRVIDRRVTVRVVVTEHVTDRRCRLTEGLING